MTRESVALASECLGTLMLMQALPMSIECQKILLSLLLEAILMVLSGTEDDVSLVLLLNTGDFNSSLFLLEINCITFYCPLDMQEICEIRSVAIKLVSHLVQIPSAALHLKDVLLEMSAAHRQQIQVFMAYQV